jgi:hypothetical protein
MAKTRPVYRPQAANTVKHTLKLKKSHMPNEGGLVRFQIELFVNVTPEMANNPNPNDTQNMFRMMILGLSSKLKLENPAKSAPHAPQIIVSTSCKTTQASRQLLNAGGISTNKSLMSSSTLCILLVLDSSGSDARE